MYFLSTFTVGIQLQKHFESSIQVPRNINAVDFVGKSLFLNVVLQDDQKGGSARGGERHGKVCATDLKFVFPPFLSSFPLNETLSCLERRDAHGLSHK
jgi:hypothetical protein